MGWFERSKARLATLGEFLKQHNVGLQVLILVGAISSLAYYNYTTQRSVFLRQLNSDTGDLAQSIRSSVEKFHLTEHTLGLQRLVKNISLDLDIFEFRYLDGNGVTLSSMFEEEIGKPFARAEVERLLTESGAQGRFYEEVRDFTQVLAISYPVRRGDKLVGIIDMAVDISSFRYQPPAAREALRRQKQGDIRNLLSAITGSVQNSLEVIDTVNIESFLTHLVSNSHSVKTITILDGDGRVVASSARNMVGKQLSEAEIGQDGIERVGDGAIYRVHLPLQQSINGGTLLLLAFDASTYSDNERALFLNLIATASLVMFFSIAIAWSIYSINMERSRRENMRLEQMVRERTAEIERLSKTDKLTGLLNRMALDEEVEREFRRAVRYQHPLTMMVVDLDHFKLVNDTYGHLGGDEVLRTVGMRLRRKLRDTDVVGRYGGEEFVILLPETELDAALKLAEELRQLIAVEPACFENATIPITASIGVSPLEVGVHASKDLFAHADSALYHAKHSGRNCVSCMEHGKVRPASDRVGGA